MFYIMLMFISLLNEKQLHNTNMTIYNWGNISLYKFFDFFFVSWKYYLYL